MSLGNDLDTVLKNTLTYCKERNCSFVVKNEPKIVLDAYGFSNWSGDFKRYEPTASGFYQATQYALEEQFAVLSRFGFRLH